MRAAGGFWEIRNTSLEWEEEDKEEESHPRVGNTPTIIRRGGKRKTTQARAKPLRSGKEGQIDMKERGKNYPIE